MAHTTYIHESGSLAIADSAGFQGHAHEIILVNPENREYTRYRGDSVRGNCFVLGFGAYTWTRLLVWEDHLESALEIAIDWIADHAPGLLCDDAINDAYNEAIVDGETEDDATQLAYEGTVSNGSGQYVNEWIVCLENPDRATLLNYLQAIG